MTRCKPPYVAEHPGAHGQQLTDNVDSSGSKQLNLDAWVKAIELGLIREEPCGPAASKPGLKTDRP